jgi:hypothetical protein
MTKMQAFELEGEGIKELVTAVLEHLAEWPIPSAEAFRNAVLGDGVTIINPLLGITSKNEIALLQDALVAAVSQGRMIDFGFIPNAVLKEESLRSRTLYEAGELQQPYEDWVAVSSWEGGICGYYFTTSPFHPSETLCMELYGVRLQPSKADVVLVYDVVAIEAVRIGETRIRPARLILEEQNTNEQAMEARAANLIDPLVTMLTMLADASIPVIDRPAPDRLNRLRVRQGKFPIPPHAVVQTRDYVSTFHAAASAKGAAKGGHHASPVAHTRRAHLRHLSDGKVIPVRSSKVNWRDAEALHRLFYRVPGKVS